MFQFTKGTDEKILWVRVMGEYPVKQLFDFHLECATTVERSLLEKHLVTVMEKHCEELRRVSYLAGWRMAKSKKMQKRRYFNDCVEVMDWEKKEAGL